MKRSFRSEEEQEIEVIFSDPGTTQIASDASPFTVELAYDLPNSKVEDPFNLRGLRSRSTPQPRTMKCRVEPYNMQEFNGQNALSKGFAPNVQTRLHQSLLDVEALPTIARGLGVLHAGKLEILDTAHLVEPPPDLMTIYRQPHEQAQHSNNGENQTTATISKPHQSTRE